MTSFSTPSNVIRAVRALPVVFPLIAISTIGYGVARDYSGTEQQRLSDDSKFVGLHETAFTSWTLVAKHDISSTCQILTLRPPPRRFLGEDDTKRVLDARCFREGTWSVRVKQPALQVERAYSPIILAAQGSGDGTKGPSERCKDLTFLVRRDGEVSRYMCDSTVGSKLELRGPAQELAWSGDPDETYRTTPVDEVLFLAGGTGIAPALQVATSLASNPEHTTFLAGEDGSPTQRDAAMASPAWRGRMTILWMNRRREDCAGGIDDDMPLATIEPESKRWKDWTASLFFSPTAVEAKPIAPGPPNDIVNTLEALRTALPRKETEDHSTASFPPDLPVRAAGSVSRPSTSMLGIKYLVDQEGTSLDLALLERLLQRPPPSRNPPDRPFDPSDDAQDPPHRRAVIVSGPPGFIEHYAGPKDWKDGIETQGPLGGVLGSLKREGLLKKWTVYKL